MESECPLIRCASPQIGEEEIEAVAEVMRSGQLCGGPKVKEFERAFAEWHGGDPDCYVAVSSGTAALQAALVCSGVGPGHEVIAPALTFAATATAALMLGARVVFADVNDHFQMEETHARSLVTPFTQAVVPVHYLGDFCTVPPPRSDRYGNAAIIEDCAQAHGTSYNQPGRGVVNAGNAGDFACWSFFATKALTTGEGGMVRCPDAQTAEIARQWRGHGLTNRWNHAFLGGNYRMTEMAAAIGLVQLTKIDRLTDNRRRVSRALLDGTHEYPCLSCPAPRPEVKHTYFWAPVLVDEEALGMTTPDLISHLASQGVEVRHRYPVPLYRLPVFLARNNPQPEPLPTAEKLAGRFIGLPNRPDMADWEIERVQDVLRGIPVPVRWQI